MTMILHSIDPSDGFFYDNFGEFDIFLEFCSNSSIGSINIELAN